MKYYILFTCFFILSSLGSFCQADTMPGTIKILLNKKSEGTIYLKRDNQNFDFTDSFPIKSKSITIDYTIHEPQLFSFSVNIKKRPPISFSLFVEPGKDAHLNISLMRDTILYHYSGNETQASFEMFCKGEDTIMATYNNRDSLEIFHKYFIKKNPDAYASSIAILFNASSWNADTLAHYLSILSPVIRNFKYGKFSDEILTRKKNNEVGSPMQQITALDWLGNYFASSQLSGKYMLLEFWASWCEPCRKSFPELQ